MPPRPEPQTLIHTTITLLLVISACAGRDTTDTTDTTDTPSATTPTPTVVTVLPATPPALMVAVQACAGLDNRKLGGSVFVHIDGDDAQWLEELQITAAETLDAAAYAARCLQQRGRCVRYDYATQKALLPPILTAGAVLGAVPLDDSLGLPCPDIAFDATTEFATKNTPEAATRLVFERYGAQTTGLAMLNPGYETAPAKPSEPALNRDIGPALIDYVFARRLFVVFLIQGCIQGHAENKLLQEIVNAGLWPTPVAVFGYNNSWLVAGGYVYEAQTRCLDSRNMGAVASETHNLAFFATRSAPIDAPGQVVPVKAETNAYDATKTYVAFVVGDGDNVRFMMTTRKDWFRQRVAACKVVGAACPPLTWTLSSHLTHLAPDMLRWYYDRSHETGADHFVLPPSGHLYAYPTSLAPAAQDAFVAATEQDARLLGVSGVVHWDWVGTWHDAEAVMLPKYARKDGAIRGVFAVNVPYIFPPFAGWPAGQRHRVLQGADGGQTAVFDQRAWRGVKGGDDKHQFTPAQMAAELSQLPKGSITWVYMTSDGGLTLENSFLAVAKQLDPHVVLVSTDTAARLAIEAVAL